MSNEAFDQKMKAKLEQISPTFEEKSWEKFVPVLKPSGGGWLPSAGQIMLAIGSSAAIIYLLYDNYQLKTINQKLQVETKQNLSSKATTIIEKDTIYITKFVDRLINRYIYEKPVLPQMAQQQYIKSLENELSKVKNIANEVAIKQTIEKQISEKINDKFIPMSQQAPEIEGINTLIGKNDKSNKEEIAIQPADKSTLPKAMEALPEIAKNRPEPEVFKKHLHMALGLSSLNFNRFNGLGITSQFPFLDKFAVNLGLNYMNLPNFFEDERSYKEKRSKDFKDNFGAIKPPPNTSIKNIKSRRELIALPISFQYNYDIGRNFVLFGNLGSSLILSSKDVFDFDYSQQPGQSSLENINSKVKTPIFNNITTNLGVQKNWKRFVFEASPSFMLNTKKQPVLDRTNYGFKFNLIYKLRNY